MYFRCPKDYLVNVCEEKVRNIIGDDHINNIYRKNYAINCNRSSEEELNDCKTKNEENIWEKIDEEYAKEMVC